jgi:hypothetical protein
MTRRIAQIVSWIALAATIVPAVLYVIGGVELPRVKTWMLVATAVWFASTPLWMGRKKPD